LRRSPTLSLPPFERAFSTGKSSGTKPTASVDGGEEGKQQSLALHPTMRLPIFFFVLLVAGLFCCAASYGFRSAPVKGGEAYLEWVPARRSVAESAVQSPAASPVSNTSFVLAAERTRRKDPLNGYKYYVRGWNISEQHYWASVGFTAVPLFLIGIIWFLGFGLALLLICGCYCCCQRRSYSYSRTAYALSLIFLMLFTCAAIIGCVVLYNGQGKFHTSTSNTLDYVVGQSNYTVENLKNFSDNLAAAKKVSVDRIFLPGDIQGKIDAIETKLNSSANTLANRTKDNSRKIQNVLDSVRLYLIIVAAVMLLLAFLGFLFSILGMQVLVYILVLIGWVLVAGTFILCGVFLLFHNVIADTCVAMDDWVQHPSAHTALDDILPCVDVATANESLYRSKEVTFQLVNIVNQFVSNISNRNFPPNFAPVYYNQSGPSVPVLCNPFYSNLADRNCVTGEVDFNNASQVWKGYVCDVSTVSGSEVCITVGRITPSFYSQLTAAISVSYGSYHYGPFLSQLQDCTFVRDTFTTITRTNCPGLRQYSKWIYVGLVMVSGAVMLSLIFWVIYARERRHRKYNKQFIAGYPQARGAQDKTP
ncbi:hypothetical protein Taro_025896, partial [Colocasia esculenta]|nr:hypothetical protein [Colocasia esculenta]